MINIKKFFKEHKDTIYFTTLIAILFIVLSNSFVGTNNYNPMNTMKSYSLAGAPMMDSMSNEGMVASRSYSEKSNYIDDESTGEKLRKTSNIQLESEKENYNAAKVNIKNIAKSFEGYYTNENEYTSRYNDIDYRSYSLTLKVPVDSFESAIESVKKIADVKSFNADVFDITTQYQDIEGTLESYKKERATFQSILNKAEKVEDILKIEQQLARIQRTIDSYEKQKTNINRQTDYSVLRVSLSEKRDITYKIVTMTSFKELVSNVIGSFDNLLIFISQILGWLIPVVILWYAWKGVKRLM